MKIHVLVGVETLVCMAVSFSGSRGQMTHDVNFLRKRPLDTVLTTNVERR
jgi:hypothetical protein